MKYFNCDYSEGMAKEILDKIVATNMEQTLGYGEDEYSQSAIQKIKKACQSDADVHFLVGGTQTNLTFISAVLRPHQAIISADSGHINVHETGAVENCGHKVLAVPSPNGKITVNQVREIYNEHMDDANRIHTVQPKMVYISNPTELGTTYSKEELSNMYDTCQENGLILYIDGARLAYGLADTENEMDLPFIANHCDALYIGGTKCGAMFGEALLIVSEILKADFSYLMKQKGALLAKGRMIGLQFDVLFTDGLYERLGQHGVAMAQMIRAACQQAGYEFLVKNGTNQIFPIIPTAKLNQLKGKYQFMGMGEVKPGYEAVRFCTSWATSEKDVAKLVQDI